MNKETFSEDFRKHLEILGYSKGSQHMLPACIAEFIEYTSKPLQEIKTNDITSYHEYLGIRPNKRKEGGLSSIMISHHMYAVRLFLNDQEQNGTITENPISGLSFPKGESQQREILSYEEIRRLYDTTGTYREKAILGIFYGCGLRRSEGEALNVKDISFESSLLYVRQGKGNKRRAVPINPLVTKDITEYINKERYVEDDELALIADKRGCRTNGGNYNKTVKELVKKAGIKKEISLHSLRHSIATHLLDNGMSIEYVRDFLGHKHLDSTQIYTQIGNKQLHAL